MQSTTHTDGQLISAAHQNNLRLDVVTAQAGITNVKDPAHGAVGDGVADDTAAIVAALAALPTGGILLFPSGTYKYVTAPNFAVAKLRIVGLGKVVWQFNGTGNAAVFDAGSGSQNIFDVQMDNITISGTASCTNGLYLRGVHHSVFRDIRVRNCSAAGLLTNFTVLNTYENFTVSVNEGSFTTTPVNGIVLDQRSASEPSTASVFINPIIEGVSGSGIKLVKTSTMTFINGSSEANARGIELGSGAVRNKFEDMDLEANSTEDILCGGTDNLFLNVLAVSTGAAGVAHFSSTAANNTVLRGVFNNITLDASSAGNTVMDAKYNFLGTGAFTDNGTGTVKIHNYDSTAAAFDDTQLQQRLLTPASSTAKASFRVPHGTAPTSPVNGDMWTTTAGLFVRINGSTVGPLT